jgi:hypothetical protein
VENKGNSMNTIISRALVFACALLAPQNLHAQGTMTYLSNLGQLSNGSNAVGSDSWLAALFYTGANAAGYSLDSVQLGMADASGSPSDFTAMIYGMNSKMIGGIFPGSSLGTLDGSLVGATNFLAIGTSGYYGARISVTNGIHTVTSSRPVGVEVYGFGFYDAYGYFGGTVK